MKIAGPISALLHHKGAQIWSIPPEATVFEAIQMLADKNIGALLVMNGERLTGIFSERDYTRKVILKGRSSKETKVREIISTPVIFATPDHTVEDCMRLMTDHRVRHLPILDGERVIGVVSIGDLVNWIISIQSAALDQMEQYLSGGYPG